MPAHVKPDARLLAVLALLAMLAPVGTDMYLPAFPQMASELGVSDGAIQLTLTAFMIGLAIGQLFWGPVSDRFGRQRPLILASIGLVAASVLAATSESIGILVLARLLQGVSGSAGIVIGRAIARDLVTGMALAKVIGLLAVIGGIAPIAAPVIGGLLVEPIGWQGILWVLTGFSVVTLAAVMLVVRETLAPASRSGGGLAALRRSVGMVLGDRVFLGYTLVKILGFGALFAFVSGSSFVLQDQYGLTSSQYSGVFALNAIALVSGMALNTRLLNRIETRTLLRWGVIGLAGSAAGMGLVVLIVREPPLALFQVMVIAMSFSVAPIMANATALGLMRHGANAGMASAVLGFAQFSFAGLVSPAVALGGGATVASVTTVIVVCSAMGTGAYVWLCRPKESAIGVSVP